MMKHVYSFGFFTTLLVGLLFTSCLRDEELIETDTIGVSQRYPVDFAQKLNNPYTIENMTKAVDSIKAKLAAGDYGDLDAEVFQNLEVRPTHLYVQFSPIDEKQETILKRDSTMVLSDYPLDYEFSDAFFKIRPDLANRKIPHYYVAVPVDKKLPTEVPHDILEELFIPEELPAFNPKLTPFAKVSALQTQDIKKDEVVLGHLLDKAYSISGYSEQLQKKETDEGGAEVPEPRFVGPRWTPSGTIMIWDDHIGSTTTTTATIVGYEQRPCGDGDDDGFPDYPVERREPIMCSYPIYETVTTTTPGSYVPLEGAQVLIRQLFTVRQGITDANGYFSTGTVRGRARYIIQWERYQYSIRDSWLGQAETRGPKQRSAWNYTIQDGSLAEYYGTIHRAAHHYYYKDIKGLRRPPQNDLFKTQMKIRAYNEENNKINGSHKEERRFLGLGSQIKIYNPQNQSKDIYATTIHELAHASHWDLSRSDFDDSESIVKESWARGVEWELTRMIYPNYEPFYIRLRYTGVVEDLIDGFKIRNSFRFWDDSQTPPWINSFMSYQDNVQSYSIRQLEDALEDQQTWQQWHNKIINTINNETSYNVQDSFDFWNSQ